MDFKLKIDSKYDLEFTSGRLLAFRGGEPWRDLVGDKLVLAMAQRIREQDEEIASLKTRLEEKIEARGDLW